LPDPAIFLPPPLQHDEYDNEDASDEENEDNVSLVSSCPDVTPIEMFPPSDTPCFHKVTRDDNVTVKDVSHSTMKMMCPQQTLKEEDAMEDEKLSM